MSQATLRTVTLKTVANYGHAAETAVGTYRRGGHRLISAIQRRVDRAAARGAEVIMPRLFDAVRRASHQVGAIAGKGVDAVSTRTERAIELGKAGVTAQVERVATLAGRLDGGPLATGLGAAVRLSMPGAKAALKASERVAASADMVHGKVAGKPAAKAARAAAKPAATAKKQARKAVATVKRAARKAAAKVAPVAKAPRARRAAKTSAATTA